MIPSSSRLSTYVTEFARDKLDLAVLFLVEFRSETLLLPCSVDRVSVLGGLALDCLCFVGTIGAAGAWSSSSAVSLLMQFPITWIRGDL